MNSLILVAIIVLGIILAIVAFIVILKSKPKPQVNNNKTNLENVDFEDLMAIAKNPNSDANRLLFALEKFNEKYIIDDENEQRYLIFFSRILTHQNVDKNIFQYFHKNIKSKNLHYKKDLDLIEQKALG